MKHNKYSKLKIPKCPICEEEMELDDIDYNFDGNQDNYFICKNNCSTSWFQKIRYDKVVYERLEGLDDIPFDEAKERVLTKEEKESFKYCGYYAKEGKKMSKNDFIYFTITPFCLAKLLLAFNASGIKNFSISQQDNDLMVAVCLEELESAAYPYNKNTEECVCKVEDLENE